MCSQCLTISQCTKFGIFTSTGSSSFFHQLLVESSAVLHLCLVFFLCFLELGNNRFITLTIPVRTQVITKVLDRINIIISDQQVAISFLCFAQWTYQSQFIITVCGRSFQFIGYEVLAQLSAVTDCRCAVFLFSCQIEMSPVDTNIITLFLQNLLIAASGTKE